MKKFALVATGLTTFSALAEETATQAASAADLTFLVGNLWILIAAALVFIMHLGFACIESGFSQSKNTVNVLFKNISVVAIGLLTYYLVVREKQISV